MRKGADILSKWVGEAERQLRLLFEEAQKAQPAIIFFDEIDGLAPVRPLPGPCRNTLIYHLTHHHRQERQALTPVSSAGEK